MFTFFSWPLPVSYHALMLAFNGATVWLLLPEAVNPRWPESWYHYIMIGAVTLNVVLAMLNLYTWMELRR